MKQQERQAQRHHQHQQGFIAPEKIELWYPKKTRSLPRRFDAAFYTIEYSAKRLARRQNAHASPRVNTTRRMPSPPRISICKLAILPERNACHIGLRIAAFKILQGGTPGGQIAALQCRTQPSPDQQLPAVVFASRHCSGHSRKSGARRMSRTSLPARRPNSHCHSFFAAADSYRSRRHNVQHQVPLACAAAAWRLFPQSAGFAGNVSQPPPQNHTLLIIGSPRASRASLSGCACNSIWISLNS